MSKTVVVISPEVRAQAQAEVAQFKEALPTLVNRIRGGRVDLSLIIYLATFLTSFARAVGDTVKAPGGPGAIGGELLDGYTGADAGAITLDFLPGATPEKAEEFFDAIKPFLEDFINNQVQPLSVVVPPPVPTPPPPPPPDR